MKQLLVLVTFFALSAQAATSHKFTCKTNVEDKSVTIKFQVSDLFGKKPRLEVHPEASEDSPVRVTPKTSALNELNDNLSFGVGQKELNIKGDADGVFQVGLALYRNSDFTAGFVRAQGDVKFYAKVSCKVKEE